MEAQSAVALLNNLVLKPGWSVVAEDYCRRHEGCVKVDVTYPAYRSERELAPDYFELVPDGAKAAFVVAVGDINDDCELYRRLLHILVLEIEMHEWREFLRVRPTMWAPFHPHRLDGQNRWGTPEKDRIWGVA